MRIIGGHDYYDSAMAYGQDEALLYIRNDVVMPVKDCPLVPYYPHGMVVSNPKFGSWMHESRIKTKTHIFNLESISLYIAGKHYGGVWVIEDCVHNRYEEIFWDYDKFESFVREQGWYIFKPTNEYYSWSRDVEYKTTFPNLKDWMTPREVSEKALNWIIDNKAVIAINHTKGRWVNRQVPDWHINCASKEFNLKDLGFARAVDPYTLYQELSMFVGGVIPRESNGTVEITDPKIKIAKHGFDNWSFRKMPEQN